MFRRYHVEDLKLKPSVFDLCLFFKSNDSGLQQNKVTQVDGTLGGGDDEFAAFEERKSETFDSKQRTNTLSFQFTVFGLKTTNQEAKLCTKHATVQPSKK